MGPDLVAAGPRHDGARPRVRLQQATRPGREQLQRRLTLIAVGITIFVVVIVLLFLSLFG